MVVILSAFAKIHYKLTLSLYCTPVTCFLRENVGGSEKNRLITGADVRTGDLLPPLVNGFVDDALQDAGPCVNEALLQVDCVCHGPPSCTDAAASGPKCGNRLGLGPGCLAATGRVDYALD